MPEREAEWEETFETVGSFGTVRVKAYIERLRGSRDEVAVHTYVGEPPDTTHDIHRFIITDEDEQICKYKTTRGKAEPDDIGLWGLQEYGWDCANFGLPSDDERTEDNAETLSKAAQAFVNMSDNTEYETVESLLVDAAVSLQAASVLLEPDADGRPTIERFNEGESVDFDSVVPESHHPPKTAAISDRLTDRISEAVADATDAGAWSMQDERTIRAEDKTTTENPNDDPNDE